jgi:hypothetical protein
MALHTYNTVFKYGEETPTTEVRIKDFPAILGKRSAIEITDLSDDAQRYLQGIRQQSEAFEFNANYDPAVYAAINALGDKTQKCALTFSDGSGYTWEGQISAAVNEGSVDAVIEMTISVVPNTVPVWAQGNA